jgi:hypothetical protein
VNQEILFNLNKTTTGVQALTGDFSCAKRKKFWLRMRGV